MEDHDETNRKRRFIVLAQATLAEVAPEELGIVVKGEKVKASPHRVRDRRDGNDIFHEQGPYYVRRAYRMSSSSFWNLHSS